MWQRNGWQARRDFFNGQYGSVQMTLQIKGQENADTLNTLNTFIKPKKRMELYPERSFTFISVANRENWRRLLQWTQNLHVKKFVQQFSSSLLFTKLFICMGREVQEYDLTFLYTCYDIFVEILRVLPYLSSSDIIHSVGIFDHLALITILLFAT